MINTEGSLREAKRTLDRFALSLTASAPTHSALARRRRLSRLEARYAEMSRRYEQLRAAGTEGIADLKVALEKSFDAFRSEIGSEA